MTVESVREIDVASTLADSLHATVSKRRLVAIVIGVMLSMLLSAIDQTIVGTAMPHVIAELNGLEHYAWVFTAYMLASTVMVPIYGKLSDSYGRRPFYLFSMVLFLLGSALSGTSQTMTQLIFYRAIQGLGAGGMLPIVQAIIGDVFPPAERGKWQGLMMAVFGLATIVGPTAGGWITDNWGWRWVFYVNMPIGLLALAAVAITLPKGGDLRKHRIDYPGAVTLVIAAAALLLALSWGGTTYPWNSAQIIGLFALALVVGVIFFLIENHSAEPIISPGLFKNSIFAVSVITSVFLAIGMFGASLYLPLFMQAVMGTSATNSGAVLTPMMLGFMFSSIVGGQILSRTGRYKVLAIVGFTIGTIGMFLLTRMDVNATNSLLIRNMIILGLGIGGSMSLFTIVVQNAFPFARLGQVTASLQFFRSIGGTIGVAIFGTILSNKFQSGLQANMPAVLKQFMTPERLKVFDNPEVLLSSEALTGMQKAFAGFGAQGEALFKQLLEAIRISLSNAIVAIFTLGTIFMVLALVATFFLREIPLRKSHHHGPTVTE